MQKLSVSVLNSTNVPWDLNILHLGPCVVVQSMVKIRKRTSYVGPN